MARRSPKPDPKKRPAGQRPAGFRLTEDQKRLIITITEAGGTDYVAAEVSGISARTFREWRQRAEGRHPDRPSTPELRKFFDEVDAAAAKARMRREIEVADKEPKHWLKYRARSKPGLEGWTEPVPEDPHAAQEIRAPSAKEVQEMVSVLVASGGVSLPPCADPSCLCSWHRPTPREVQADEG